MKSIKTLTFLSAIVFALAACGDLDPKAKPLPVHPQSQSPQSEALEANTQANAETDADEEADLEPRAEDETWQGPRFSVSTLKFNEAVFVDYQWYAYNMFNHRVYPAFDVYAVRSSSGQYYKVQIIDYYSKLYPTEGGYYELRVQGPDGKVKTIDVSAAGCGNPVGGVAPSCDGEQSFALLNLDTAEVVYASDIEASQMSEWDLGFKRTDIIMNSPSLGVGQTLAALLYRNEDFFGLFGFANYDKLEQAYVTGGELETFNAQGLLVP